MGREIPSPKLPLLPICVNKVGRRGSGKQAKEGLQLVPGHGVPHKSYVLVANELEKSAGFKPGKLALAGFPPPVEITQISSSMSDAVLTFLDCPTGCAIVQRTQLFMDPFAPGVVTCRCSFFSLFLRGGNTG